MRTQLHRRRHRSYRKFPPGSRADRQQHVIHLRVLPLIANDVAEIDPPPVLALNAISQPTPPQKRYLLPSVYRRGIGKLAAMVGVFLLAFVALFFGATTIVSYGPSPTARNLFVSTVMETSAAKFLATMYFDDEEIAVMLAGDTAKAVPVVTNADAVTVAPQQTVPDHEGITVEDVRGKTFVGKIMIVDDPARIFVKTLPTFDEYGEGMALADMIAESGAVAGINAGGFLDPNGLGKGGMPMGAVISGGKLLCNTETQYPTIVGFDASYKLIAGDFSVDQALAMGIQEAVSFGPVLVSNGKIQPLSGGLNPRTAIGQRADGAVLLLVVDGRQPHSLGATHGDIASLMVQYGAVNAANLDGGSSSLMIYKGEVLNAYSMLTGPRKLPTAFLVRGMEESSDEASA